MKISWTSLKVSIAGAKLSHLVQKDKIWDHGSMAEQARIIFYLVHKAKANGNRESLKKQCTIDCFEKLQIDILENDRYEELMSKSPLINELAIVDVQPGKSNRPDTFCALIKWQMKDGAGTIDDQRFFSKWAFVRQGDWWLLNYIK